MNSYLNDDCLSLSFKENKYFRAILNPRGQKFWISFHQHFLQMLMKIPRALGFFTRPVHMVRKTYLTQSNQRACKTRNKT